MTQVRDAAIPSETALVRALFRDYANSLGFDLDFQDFEAELEGLPGEYASPMGCLLLAECEGEVTGCVALRPFAEGVCEMKRLYVREDSRGSGIGRVLAESVIARAREMGYATMRLDTVSTMAAANALYRSLGFVEIAQYRPNPVTGARYFELELWREPPETPTGEETTERPESGAEYSESVFKRVSFVSAEIASSSFRDCRFVRCDFREALLRACLFENCSFEDCDLSVVKLPHCAFTSTDFENSKIIGVNWTEAAWPSKPLRTPVRFRKCKLDNSTFLGLEFVGVALVECSARDADFREADLSKADLSGTDLGGALFGGTNLSEADLRGATDYWIDPRENTLKGAKFSLPEAMSLLAGLDVEIEGLE